MKRTLATAVAPLAILALSLAGCADPAPADDGSENPFAPSTDSEGSDGASQFGATGGAIVEVDGETFEYGGLGCELDYAASDGKTYAWSAGKMRTIDKKSINFQFGAFDPSGQGRVSGDGVTYNIVMLAYGYPLDSTIDVNANGMSSVTIAGDTSKTSEKTLKVSGQFASEDGTMHTIKVDAQCASTDR